MSAANYNLVAYKGVHFERTFFRVDPAGEPIALTGFGVSLKVFTHRNSTNVVTEMSTGNGRVILGPATNQFTVRLTQAETAALNAGEYVYNLDITDNGNITHRWLRGSFTLFP